MTSPARIEREALCDLFLALGPDAPTMCGDWTTRDLAAHLVVRERRPDAAPGILSRLASRYSERVRLQELERPWPEIVERVRSGPPRWNPMAADRIDELTNSAEFFVHHEDVRRAQPKWAPRRLPADLEDTLDGVLRRGSWMLVRKAQVGLIAEPRDRRPIRLRKGEPEVTMRGPLGECVLYAYGRKSVAEVRLDGPPDAVEHIAAARFGL